MKPIEIQPQKINIPGVDGRSTCGLTGINHLEYRKAADAACIRDNQPGAIGTGLYGQYIFYYPGSLGDILRADIIMHW